MMCDDAFVISYGCNAGEVYGDNRWQSVIWKILSKGGGKFQGYSHPKRSTNVYYNGKKYGPDDGIGGRPWDGGYWKKWLVKKGDKPGDVFRRKPIRQHRDIVDKTKLAKDQQDTSPNKGDDEGDWSDRPKR